MAKPRDIIEAIRRDEFGIGVDLDPQARTIVANYRRKYTSVLANVAEDLNSKEFHFILELIQNADDNSYSPISAPKLSFLLDRNSLVVVNNETGFTEENVRALCSAGESSKKSKSGYIGEKGIGFKSVFKVTDAPEIHSNGYHFRFDRTARDDLLAYVVPHWHETHVRLEPGATTLVLPAKPGRSFTLEVLEDVGDALLLFLGKLRRLEVEAPGRKESFERQDEGAVTTLTTRRDGKAPVSKKYLRIRRRIDTDDLREPKREGILTTDVVLAFPLGRTGEASPESGCATYAFLPIRDFGFNFYIQADFVLTSSREGIHEELAWNIRLRDCISTAFSAAVEEFKAVPELAHSFLRYLPSGREVREEFFSPVVDQIQDGLKNSDCIPTESGNWSAPSKVLIAPDQARELFPSTDALLLFGADYPLRSFHFPPGLQKVLGCKFLDPEDIAAIFVLQAKWFLERDDLWKARFFAYLAESPMRKDFVQALSCVACLPTTKQALATPAADTVFFPLNTKRKYGFEHELNVLDASVHEKATAISRAARSFFEELNVRQDNPLELIQSHILPFHASEKFASAENDAVLGHVRYVRDRLQTYLALASATQTEAEAIKKLTSGLLIGTKSVDENNWQFSRAQELYLGKEFQPDFCLESLLGEVAPLERIVTAKYLTTPRKGADPLELADALAQWREFFLRIGVKKSPRTEVQSSGNVNCSTELLALLGHESTQVRRKTLECLDANWAHYAGQTTYLVRNGKSTTNYWTSFASQLKKTTAPTKRKVQVALESTFLENDDTKSVLGTGTVFVDAVLVSAGFLDTCGIAFRVDAQACLKRLRQIRDEGRGGAEQVRKIYRRLESIWLAEHTTIENAFRSQPLIRVGLGESATWATLTETSWIPTGVELIDQRHHALSSQYKDFFEFFTKLLKIPREIGLDKWVDGLRALKTIPDSRERESAATAIYRRLNKAAKQFQESSNRLVRPPWLTRFDREALLLDHRGELVAMSAVLFADDSPELSALFADAQGISFLAIATERLPSVAAFLEVLKIPRASDVLTVEATDGLDGKRNEQLSKKLREMVIPIARVVYTQSHDRFEVAIAEGAFHLLSQAVVIEVVDLTQTLTLGSTQRVTTGHVARRGHEFLLSSSAASKLDHLAMEVSKLVRLPKGASDAISRLLIAPSMDDAISFLGVRGFRNLPPEDELNLRASESPKYGANSPVSDEINGYEAHDAQGEHEQAGGDGHPEDAELIQAPVGSAATGGGLPPEGRAPKQADSRNEGGNPGSAPTEPPRPGASVGPASASLENQAKQQIVESAGVGSGDATGPLTGTRGNPGGASTGQGLTARHEPAKRKQRTSTGRLLSYAEHGKSHQEIGETDSETDPKIREHKMAVERAAVAIFMELASAQWKTVREMPQNNPGFDIQAVAMDGADEVIEIKGQAGAWTEEGVALTSMELATAHRLRDRYWLCVVEHALDESRRRLSLIRDPFGKVNQFRFDRGWKDVAERMEGKPNRPELGLFVDVPGKGRGRIVELKGKAAFSRMKVELPNKSTIFAIFNPATMKLSLD